MANSLSIHRYWFWAALSAATIALVGCANRPPAPQLSDQALPAQYVGNLPCADCGGIVYRLTLGHGRRYVLRQHYKTTQPTPDIFETGRWTVDDGQRLTLTPADTDYAAQSVWRIDNDGALLTALDDQGRALDASTDYQLSNQTAPADLALTGVRWQLANAPEESIAASAYIQFDADASQLAGSTGCNRLTAAYHRNAQELSITRLATTRRDCPGRMDTEQSLTTALRQTTQFTVLGHYLLLFGTASEPAPLAIFHAAD
ncbi:META domain-containing protein [Salinisphaera sp. SPP-AMP-43]|uniref:META domain-containing protein n=1 Tax=Salinisphaera sp. SPP-AMP-43 TaxID=3121288 RepID=UPI003C6E5133